MYSDRIKLEEEIAAAISSFFGHRSASMTSCTGDEMYHLAYTKVRGDAE